MKTILCSAAMLAFASGLWAATTINSANKYAYGANTGWMDWRGDVTNGAVIGEFVLKGYIYAANVGWINLGSGNPTNGIRYSNTSTNDFGVNNLGTGELRGFAYGANIGWVILTNGHAGGLMASTDVPRFDLITGNFSGYAYSANCGWISLSNASAFVKTDFCQPGADTDGDGIADVWELLEAGDLSTMNASTDSDGDGVLDKDEYAADTGPFESADFLRITAYSANSAGSTSTVTWTSRQTRLYQIQTRNDLVAGAWSTNNPPGLVSPDGATTTRDAPGAPVTNQFFRIQAIQPLKP